MSWLRTLLGIVALVTLSMVVHPPSVLAIEVRSGPGMTYEVMAKVPPGEATWLWHRQQDWYKIQLPDGREGWIHRFYAGQEQPPSVQEQPPSRTAPVVATPPATPSPVVATPPATPSPVATPPPPRLHGPPAASAMPSKAQPPAFRPAARSRRALPRLCHAARPWSLATRRMRWGRYRMRSRMRRISQRCCAA